MNGMLLFSSAPFKKIKPAICNIFSKRVSYSTVHLPFENLQNLKKDVLLYSFEKTKVFKYLTIFGIAQLGVWIFYAGYLFTGLRNISKSNIQNEDVFTQSSLWRRINLGDIRYRIISTVLCLGVGGLTTFITFSLPSRIVKELVLCKGGAFASFVTYGPFGNIRSFKAPLQHLSCVISREEARSYIPIKIKSKRFFYLVDCKGHFHQPKLFDYTLGTKSVKVFK